MLKQLSIEDTLFIGELVALGKSAEGVKVLRNSPYLASKIHTLHKFYGKEAIDQAIETVKGHEALHTMVQTVMERGGNA